MTSTDGRPRSAPGGDADGAPDGPRPEDTGTVRRTRPARPDGTAPQTAAAPSTTESSAGVPPAAVPSTTESSAAVSPAPATVPSPPGPAVPQGPSTSRSDLADAPVAAPPGPPSPAPGAYTGPGSGPPAPAEEALPVRRPVPPTFPSPGQPPPGVARRDGRHARPDRVDRRSPGAPMHTPPEGYRPRHAAPDAETEQFASPTAGAAPAAPPTPVTGTPLVSVPAPDADGAVRSTPFSRPIPAIDTRGKKPLYGGGEIDPDAPPSDRVRVVLAERRSPTRAVRTVAEIEQQTETGEFLLGNLLRAQLTLGIRLGLVAVLVLGALPVLFAVLPSIGDLSVLGIRVPWVVLGLAPYPFMLVLAWLYTRTAERNELDFADNVED